MNDVEADRIGLADCAVISAGFPFRGKIEESNGSGVRVVQMRDVGLEEGIAWGRCIEARVELKRESGQLEQGDILFAARGNHHYAIHIESIPSGMHILAAPHFFVIRSLQRIILPAFLSWYLNQESCQRYFARASEGTGTKSIRRAILDQTPVVIPSMQEQRKIIALNTVIRRERLLLQTLIENGEKTLTAIATQLEKEIGQS